MIEKYYEAITNNEKLSAKEKLETLETLFEEIQKENKSYLKSAKENILNNYLQCPICEDYYDKSSYKYDVSTEIVKRCTNQLTGGYLDDYEYENAEECFKYAICPKGHRFKVMRIW